MSPVNGTFKNRDMTITSENPVNINSRHNHEYNINERHLTWAGLMNISKFVNKSYSNFIEHLTTFPESI